MDGFKDWCIIISALSVISGIATILVPKSGVKPTYRILSCIVMLYVLIQPFTDGGNFLKDISNIFDGIYRLDSTYENDIDSEEFIAQQTYEKYFLSLITHIDPDVKCECCCEYTDSVLKLKSVTFIGTFTDKEKDRILNAVKAAIDETTIVEFRSDSDGKKQ